MLSRIHTKTGASVLNHIEWSNFSYIWKRNFIVREDFGIKDKIISQGPRLKIIY